MDIRLISRAIILSIKLDWNSNCIKLLKATSNSFKLKNTSISNKSESSTRITGICLPFAASKSITKYF